MGAGMSILGIIAMVILAIPALILALLAAVLIIAILLSPLIIAAIVIILVVKKKKKNAEAAKDVANTETADEKPAEDSDASAE